MTLSFTAAFEVGDLVRYEEIPVASAAVYRIVAAVPIRCRRNGTGDVMTYDIKEVGNETNNQNEPEAALALVQSGGA